MRDHKPSRVLIEYMARSDVDRRIIYIPQEQSLQTDVTKFHTVFISQHYDGKQRPLTLWEPFRSEVALITWEESTQTLTMGLGTTIFCIEIDKYSFLMALTIATDWPHTLNLDILLNRGAKDSEKWFELDEALFEDSAAHMGTYHGQLSPKHQLDIRLKKGLELGEGCWYVDIDVTLCEPEVPDNRDRHINLSDNNRSSKSRRFRNIFS